MTGFDFLVTSNNHSNDSGLQGVNHTIDVLQSWGFYQTGTFKNQMDRDAFYPLIMYRDDFKIAFLNYTYDTNGIPTTPPSIVNEIDEEQIEADMKMAQLLQPDIIIVLMHWGPEYAIIESKKQDALAKKILNWGADLIIGAHPHVVQPIRAGNVERPDGTKEEILVAYSLGNFISNQTKPKTDGGIIFEIELIKNQKTKKVTLGEHHYIPVWRYIHKDKTGKSTYHAIPISAFENGSESKIEMTKKDINAMNKYAKHVREHLSQSNSTERKIPVSDLEQVLNQK